MDRLDFKPVELNDRDDIYRYMSEFGEGSCQHSFVSMYSLSEKYGDSFCILDDMLYTLRSKLCDDEYRVYLAPMGYGDKRQAFINILEDAHSYQKKVKFITLTKQYANFLENEFAGQFNIEENRDLAEYIYRTGQDAYGNSVKIKVVKNKVAPPFKTAVVSIIFGEGISHIDEVVTLGVENNIIDKAGAWFSYKGEKIGQGAASVREFLKNHPEIDEEITAQIKDKLFGSSTEQGNE